MTLLSHYTDRDGLVGIARSKTLRATSFLELNDKRELLYGLTEVVKRAVQSALVTMHSQLNPFDPVPKIDEAELTQILEKGYRTEFQKVDPSEHLYVASFARSLTPDHEERGHRSLWREYTQNKGYCLQFDREEVTRFLTLEGTRRNYHILELAEVRYVLDETDPDFVELKHENAQSMLELIKRTNRELRFEIDRENRLPFAVFAQRMTSYCARHKDPFFEDEREVRILAIPAGGNRARVGSGIAAQKPVKKHADGRGYIDLFADWRPGLEPLRIIVGPEASSNLDEVLPLFNRR